MDDLAGAVLAGGSSRRMGRPKAAIEFRGELLVERPLRALREAGAEPVFVVGGGSPPMRRLHVEIVPDEHPGEGPLGGIVTALRHLSLREDARERVLAVLACDMPLVDAPIVRDIADALVLRDRYDACVPIVAGSPEPLCACYRPSALRTLERAFAEGVRSPTAALGRLEVIWFEPEDDREWVYADVDTPDDLAEMSRLIQTRASED